MLLMKSTHLIASDGSKQALAAISIPILSAVYIFLIKMYSIIIIAINKKSNKTNLHIQIYEN